MDVANDHIAIIPQIESMLGVENLEDIMQIEGIDGISMSPFTCTTPYLILMAFK